MLFKPTHQHYKGGLYQVLTTEARNEADLSSVVVYRDSDGNIWVRPWKSFHEMVNGVPRFKRLLDRSGKSVYNKVMMIRDFAMKWHGSQEYAGKPYVYHLDLVWNTLQEFGYTDPDHMMAAYCHDLFEDTDIRVTQLVDVTSMQVHDMVWAVTGIGATREERTADTIRKLTDYPDAVPLKMADRLANMRFSSQNSRKHINKYIDELPKYGEVFYGPMYEEMKLFKKVPE